eukprot:3172387-Heterocapsa_arctica.AAC.1
MGIEQKQCWSVLLKLNVCISEFVQHDKRSARNLMVIARMPEDRSETFEPFTTKTAKTLQSHMH